MGTTSVVQLPCAGGIDQKLAQEYLDPQSKLVAVQNGNFVKVGAIDKRYGVKNLPNTVVSGSLGAMGQGVRAVGWSRSGLSLLTSQQTGSLAGGLYSYSTAENGVTGVAQLPACVARRKPVVAPGASAPPVLCDFPCGSSTARLSVYYDSAFNVFATVQDLITGDMLVEPTLLYTNGGAITGGTVPYIRNVLYLPNAPVNHRVCIFIADGFTSQLYVATFSQSALSFSSFTSLVALGANLNNTTSPGTCDVAPFVGDPSGGFLVLYASTNQIVKLAYFQGTTVQTTVTVETLTGSNYVVYGMYALGNWGERVTVFYTYNTGTLYDYRIASFSGSASLTTLVAPVFAISGTSAQLYVNTLTRVDSTHVFLQYHSLANPGVSHGVNAPLGTWATYNASLSVVFTGSTPLGFLPASRAFMLNGVMYQAGYLSLYMPTSLAASATRSQQYSLYLWQYVNVTASPAPDTVSVYPIASVAPRQCDISAFFLPEAIGLAPGFWNYILSTNNFMSSSLDGQSRYGVGIKVASVDTAGNPSLGTAGQQASTWQTDFLFDSSSLNSLYQASELGNALFVSGSVPFVADSATAFEAGYFYYPEFTYAVISGSGSTTLGTGSYQWAVCYVYVDAAGLIHRSAPVFTPALSVTSGGHSPALHITALSATWRDKAVKGQVWAEVFRTIVNGGTFFYVDRVLVSGQSGTPVEVVWTDTTADSAIQSASLLYTTGGVLDRVNPPSAAMLCVHQSRVALVDETLRNVWFSTAFTAGEAPGFNEALVVPVQEGGDITAIASMDGNFVIFKQWSIWIMSGEGPAVTGQGSSWSTPARVASDVGCISWQSVVLTPEGLMFQAPNSNLYLLGRDLNVKFIGKNVSDTLAAFPTITSATLVPSATQVRFTCSNGSSTTTICYDYFLDQWCTHTYPSLTAPVVSSCLDYATNQFSLLTSDGKIWQERTPGDVNLYLDADSSGSTHFVPTTVTWAWVKPSGLQGYQRLRRAQLFADQQETCGVTMTFAVNYNPAVVQTAAWSAQQLAKLRIPGQVECHASGQVNKQQAVQVSVTDVAPAAPVTGQGMRWLGLALELDLIGPRYRQAPVGARR